jgi:hypothetical protein
VRATCRKTDQPPEARPVRRQDTAMERRGAQASLARDASHPQGAIHKERLAALHPLGVSEGREGKAGRPGPSRTGAAEPWLFDIVICLALYQRQLDAERDEHRADGAVDEALEAACRLQA